MRKSAAAAALLSLVWIGQSAWAAPPYPSSDGPADVPSTEDPATSTIGDPDSPVGALIGRGASLLFPTSFAASAPGVNGLDQTGAQLQAAILATSVTTIDIPIEPLVIGSNRGDLLNGSFTAGTPGATAPH